MENGVIDCLIIGHNDSDFSEFVYSMNKLGGGLANHVNRNYINYHNKPFHIVDAFNEFIVGHKDDDLYTELRSSNTFSSAIACIGSCLNNNGLSFSFINNYQKEKEELKDILVNNKVRTIAITTTLYGTIDPINEIIQFVKNYSKESKIIIGGPYVYTQAAIHEWSTFEYILSQINADFVVNSIYGEHELVDIIKALKNNNSFSSINNIYFKKEHGYEKTKECHKDYNLENNKIDWSLFLNDVKDHINIRTALSCPFNCAFCGFPEHAGEYRYLDVDKIKEELDRVNKIPSLKSVYFIDDTFNVPKTRFKELLKMLIKEKYKFKWHSYFRAQFADRETVELMKESGCEGVYLGIESGNDSILQNMNKSASIDKISRGIELLHEYGITTFASFIIGFPGETYETAMDTALFIKNSKIDFYRAQVWFCDTMTPIWRERDKYNITGSNFEWEHSTMDSKFANEFVDKLFVSIDDPVWIPQYNSGFLSIMHMINKGLDVQLVKKFVKIFNNIVRARIVEDQSNDSLYLEQLNDFYNVEIASKGVTNKLF